MSYYIFVKYENDDNYLIKLFGLTKMSMVHQTGLQ